MYSYKSRIRYSELDETGQLRLESLLDYFQDCSTFHSEDIGLGVDYLKERNMVWVMSSWQIVVERFPKLCEMVTVGTAPYEFKGFVGFRNFLMTDEEGKWLACANTIWSLLDTRTGKPVRPTEEMVKGYALEPKLNMDYAPRRIQIPKEMERQDAVQIKTHHLDTNHHVNNGQFVRIALDSLLKNCRVKQLRAEYKKQVMLGDVLIPYTKETENGIYVIVLKDTEENVCCTVELQEERD
ncbi:MAG: acyl-[acyl-carrier-protein] thioesterase [Lachnospiraceae bacterium]|nr:acyl-[acyl-carrier-protein] thioesterase [Lachnospiraceae bacterium]MDE6185943.1 acyl-[acyl-carrier-protein] thioesterase [Lachnospiraceae bacterium]MDE7287533.1 acyl-[acyl-carrier-protein] thioesterase [Lachnospiraceae bacterium]